MLMSVLASSQADARFGNSMERLLNVLSLTYPNLVSKLPDKVQHCNCPRDMFSLQLHSFAQVSHKYAQAVRIRCMCCTSGFADRLTGQHTCYNNVELSLQFKIHPKIYHLLFTGKFCFAQKIYKILTSNKYGLH